MKLPRIPGFGQPVIYRGTRYASYTALGAAFGRRPDDVRRRLERGLPLERKVTKREQGSEVVQRHEGGGMVRGGLTAKES